MRRDLVASNSRHAQRLLRHSHAGFARPKRARKVHDLTDHQRDLVTTITIGALPADRPLSIEIPMMRLGASVSPLERARRCLTASRQLVESIDGLLA
ncbi:hypothetical protein [Aminobacter aminovorans]|uniref:hypothetical protein n=1 Tax=Aminobacter aminovorans TaxID=83263 RepID=UPI00285A72BF|nr:hypothetical protein [Aminobacter aminovorans]MDR7221577.1 hypothetical protein [Aminobacter aminovorans]